MATIKDVLGKAIIKITDLDVILVIDTEDGNRYSVNKSYYNACNDALMSGGIDIIVNGYKRNYKKNS